jgi:hypothetical protein
MAGPQIWPKYNRLIQVGKDTLSSKANPNAKTLEGKTSLDQPWTDFGNELEPFRNEQRLVLWSTNWV